MFDFLLDKYQKRGYIIYRYLIDYGKKRVFIYKGGNYS